jgi:diguanylate cyclase (GGDEF)-like protein
MWPTGGIFLESSSTRQNRHAAETESPADPHTNERAQTPNLLRLVRMRLRLALLTMAVVPVVLSMTLFRVVMGPVPSGESVVLLVGTVLLGGVMVGLTVWMSHQILRPAEELERSGSEMRKMYETARDDSLRDALTGLGNHRAFQEELDRELEWYQRYRVPVALLLIDLDDLKMVNDSIGHAAGDEMLRDMGRMIGEVTRYADRTFRIGGDEFAVLMPHTDSEGATQIAHRLLERALQTRGTSRPIPFSGGISACPEFATTRSQLYAQADAALYWCKRHGRASVDVFHPQRDHAASQEASNGLSVQIARVVSEHLVRPVYQPIVDLQSGRVIGFEGLSRPSPDSGFSDPGTMFTAAETVGRTVELDLACLHAVVAGARTMPADQLLTINVSPRTVEAPHFSTEALLAILARHNIAPERVVVELTEREKVEDVTRLQQVLAAMQRHGLRIAADDVGAGNAGLRLLSQFRFDIVKIDLALVQEGAERESSRAILRSLRDLAGRWGASVIAEGLETASQLRVVRELGLTAGQGYLLARPLPHPDLTAIDLEPLEQGGSILDRRIPQPRQAPDTIRAQTA